MPRLRKVSWSRIPATRACTDRDIEFQLTFAPILLFMDEPYEDALNEALEVADVAHSDGSMAPPHAEKTSASHVNSVVEATREAREYAGCSPMDTLVGASARPVTPGRPSTPADIKTPARSATPADLSGKQSREMVREQKELGRPTSRMTIGTEGDVPERNMSLQTTARPVTKQQSSAHSLQVRVGNVTRRLGSPKHVGTKGSKNSMKPPTMEVFRER